MLDSPFFLTRCRSSRARHVSDSQAGPVRSCSILFGPVRFCSVRFCAIRHDPALADPAPNAVPPCFAAVHLVRSGLGLVCLGLLRTTRGGEERFCRAQAPRTDKQHRENRPIRDIARSDRENKLRTTEQTPPFHERDSARTYADIYRRQRCRSEHFDRIPPASYIGAARCDFHAYETGSSVRAKKRIGRHIAENPPYKLDSQVRYPQKKYSTASSTTIPGGHGTTQRPKLPPTSFRNTAGAWPKSPYDPRAIAR